MISATDPGTGRPLSDDEIGSVFVAPNRQHSIGKTVVWRARVGLGDQDGRRQPQLVGDRPEDTFTGFTERLRSICERYAFEMPTTRRQAVRSQPGIVGQVFDDPVRPPTKRSAHPLNRQ